jgi:hypothetical protein
LKKTGTLAIDRYDETPSESLGVENLAIREGGMSFSGAKPSGRLMVASRPLEFF